MTNIKTFIPLELIDDTSDVHYVPAPCQVACPIGTDAPSYIGYIWEENFAGALEAISATNPFSSICGRVCDAPCEPACRRAESDGPIAIRNLKRFIMDKLGPDFHLPPVPVSKDKSIAIVGGGPAGMTAAQDLAEAGYPVHVYEMSDRLGGMMVWGIPAFRLPPHIIEEDIQRILKHCPGIEVHLNSAFGTDVTLEQLKEQHAAVILAIGAWWGKKMNIPGEDDERVVDGVGFLRDINGGARPTMPETVLIVGGGDVSMDACRAVKRLPGCKNVKVVYRRGPDEIPARRDELEGAIKEDIEFVYHTQPVEVVADGDSLALHCVKTKLGEPDEDGRRRPVTIEGSEHDIECGLVIAAVGQKTESEELEQKGLMDGEKIAAHLDTMRTDEERIFATGDGGFGPSTIVNAMYLGHRTAYYVKAHLEGIEDPQPYSTPYRTRRVPVSQDPLWEVINRIDQPFHGLGEEPVEFPEIETTYTLDEAKAEAARCFRCDAENGTHEYSVNNREDIFVMARTQEHEQHKRLSMLDKRLANRDNPFPQERGARIDDIHFLPANLSRLVIDPYRDDCKTHTQIGTAFRVKAPYLVAGFDQAPEEVRIGLGRAIQESGCAYLGAKALDCTWVQTLAAGDAPSPDAAGVIYDLTGAFTQIEIQRAHPNQFVGIAASAHTLNDAIPHALDANCDVLFLDGSQGFATPWPELNGLFDLSVLRDAIALLRQLKKEEQIDVAYFGGVRSGTDAAKIMAIGCQLIVMGMPLGLAMGGTLSANGLAFQGDYSLDEYAEAALNFLTACSGETSMMARAVGKTNVHSLEPEDLRSITVATSQATGIPLIGTH